MTFYPQKYKYVGYSDKLKTLIRKRPKLWNPFGLART